MLKEAERSTDAVNDSDAVLETIRAFRTWTATEATRELDPVAAELIADFETWLQGKQPAEKRPMPFGMRVQEWPVAVPHVAGSYDPAAQRWVSDAASTQQAVSDDRLVRDEELASITNTTQLMGQTVDVYGSTSSGITFCFVIVPDDLCSSDAQFD